ncbi:MAG TPA: GNAT family N-acetyltransferase [Roseiflexaceae bacterium]|nr:GNAT family N-acetyltransferase [Roseiflexaceae bacterium]
MEISSEAALAYLERDCDANLMPLAALAYDPLQALLGAARGGALAALALVVDLAANLPDDRPTVMVAADDEDALARLLAGGTWPSAAIWTTSRPELLRALERLLGRPADPARGLRYYVTAKAARPPELTENRGPRTGIRGRSAIGAGVQVRPLVAEDADALDLAPCALSPAALRSWLRRGWRVFGAVRGGALLAHALAAYPLADTEEVSAVFTAPRARRQGLASAVAAAAIADITGRGRRAIYVTRKTNIASRRVAERLGMALMFETWEIVTDGRLKIED